MYAYQSTPRGISRNTSRTLVFQCFLKTIFLFLTVRSSSAASNGDMNEAFALGRSARSISIAGIVVGTITYIFVLAYWLSA